jgi:hypothetical protein
LYPREKIALHWNNTVGIMTSETFTMSETVRNTEYWNTTADPTEGVKQAQKTKMNSTDCPVLSDFPISCQGSICPVCAYATTNQREIVNEFSFFVALWLVSLVGFWRAQNKRDMKVQFDFVSPVY